MARGTFGRLLVRLGNGTIALAVAAGAVYAHRFVMDEGRLGAPLTTRAAAGAVAETGRFGARIEEVVVARSLDLRTRTTDPVTGEVTTKDAGVVATPQLFVVTTISATSPGAPVRLRDARLRTRHGTVYPVTGRVGPAFRPTGRTVQYGPPTDLVYVFEVPPDALAGASVVVTASSPNGVYDRIAPGRYDRLLPEAELALTADDVATGRLLDEVKESWELPAEG